MVSGNAVEWTRAGGAARYRIYVDGKLLGDTANKCYAFQALTPEQTYEIGVSAVTPDGKESAVATTRLTAVSMLDKPGQLSLTGNTLRWDAVAGAARYRVYVTDPETGDVITMNAAVNDTQYTFTALVPGRRYVLRVCAVTADGTLGKYAESEAVTAA